MQAHLPQQSFKLLGNDVTEAYASFFMDHSGGGADKCFPTTKRALCANTYRLAQQDGKGKGISIRHTGDVKGKISDARRALGIAINNATEYKEAAEAMVSFPLSHLELGNAVLDSVVEFTQAQASLGVDGILDTVLHVTTANRKAEAKRVERELRKRDSILDDICERYESSRCKPAGTAWAAFNALTESADWGRWGKERTDEASSRRLESTLVGDRDTAKQVAYTYVTNAMQA